MFITILTVWGVNGPIHLSYNETTTLNLEQVFSWLIKNRVECGNRYLFVHAFDVGNVIF